MLKLFLLSTVLTFVTTTTDETVKSVKDDVYLPSPG